MKLDIDNPEAMLYEWRYFFTFRNSLTGETFDPTPKACTHPNPFTFKLPSGCWVKRCGSCCQEWPMGRRMAPDSKPDWKPEATWISKRRFVLDALPDAVIRRSLFSNLAVVSDTFSGQTGGMSLTGWQYEDLKQIWTRAYDQLTKFDYDSVALRHVIRQARANMVEREKGRVSPHR